ncbi:hypothetical protein IM725_19710 [Ramlibacter aquaticus]|uniref:DUF937 domain-containing protein n=1 Tax=Ramlibacter aquaticus TaxID=2780094 RepID=A0ABR9SKA8_9BURK|nr:hypothetical protein [Ramlibacter aquaticus]MBE7942801.1 hypothetical protein [Ramlibacter aquaticus]
MDAQQLVTEFLASAHGQEAVQALGAQGISAPDAQQLLGNATEAVHAHVDEQSPGLMGEHAGKSFFAGLAAGLLRGDGFFKSLVDGGEGIVSGRVAESLAARAGLDPSTASTVAAAATPYILGFLKERFS